ncbi:M2K4 [Enterospora canceri]|uniref:M2K4 n=1 Tax=Enterospora canceri TaxID=1081671 RepID=A0A1Y1S490_9MICR|nr:M2K4 [Enterospora canceri]
MELTRKNGLIKAIILAAFTVLTLTWIVVVTVLLIRKHLKNKNNPKNETVVQKSDKKTETVKPDVPVDPKDLKHYSNFIVIAKKIEELCNTSDDAAVIQHMTTNGFVHTSANPLLFTKDDLSLKIGRPITEIINRVDCETIKNLKHPNVIETYQYYKFTANNSVTNDQYPVEITLSENVSPLTWNGGDHAQIKMVMKDVLEGLVYLQTKRIVHNGIILINLIQKWNGTRNVIKISNFDASVILPEGETTVHLWKIKPSWCYAPELMIYGYIGLKTDVWMIVLNVMLSMLQYNLGGASCTTLAQQWVNAYFGSDYYRRLDLVNLAQPFHPLFNNSNPNDLDHFIDCCLQIKEEDRPSPKNLLSHPFLTQSP